MIIRRHLIMLLAIAALLFPHKVSAMHVGIIQESTHRTFVPIRFLSEQFGFRVTWNSEEQSIHVQGDGKNIIFIIGSTTVLVDDEALQTDASPYIDRQTAYVPLRVITEVLDFSLERDAAKGELHILGHGRKVLLPVISEKRWRETASNPIQFTTKTISDGKNKVYANIITIDLLHPRIDLRVGLAEGKAGAVSQLEQIAEEAGAVVAINGSFFDAYTESSMKIPYGYVVSDGEMVRKASGDRRTAVMFDSNNRVEIIPGHEVPARIQQGQIEGLIQAGPRLVTNGNIDVQPEEEGFKDEKILTSSAARSALGITDDHRLILLTTNRATIPQLAEMMRQEGAVEAMNLDGGASSGLFYNGKYITKPGREISNALLIIY